MTDTSSAVLQTRHRLLWASLIALSITIAAHLANHFAGMLSAHLLEGMRAATITLLVGYAFFRRSLTTWIAVAMLVGAEIGYDFPAQAEKLRVLSTIFLNLIKTIVAPLIFSTLVVGIAGHSNLKQIGRMGVKALIYFEVVTTLALFIGLAAINISQAGAGVPVPPAAQDSALLPAAKQTGADIILHIFPENIAKSVAEGQVLQVVVFSIIFGIALAMISEAKRRPLLNVLESVSETMFKFTNVVMLLAPIGVGAAMAYTVGHMGLGIMKNLAMLLGTLYAALVAFILMVFFPVALIARVPIRRFLRAVAEPASIAFATATSEAALPRAMENMEAMGCPRHIVAFVIPTGYSFNLDGSTLYLSLASIFVAQAAGTHLGWQQQLLMVFTLMLTSKGVAGVPRASLVILLGAAASFNLPVEPIFIILGIDQLMDMARTSVNVIGNCLATVVISKWEGEFAQEKASPVVVLEGARS